MLLPKITIITPSFNQGQYIEQTITSILEQNYSNLEYIIIDGGSTDNTVDIIKKYEDKITYWVSEPDNGQAHAINKGIEKATGDIFNWINSDDYLEPGALLRIGESFQKDSNLEIFCGYTHCYWEPSKKTSHTYRMGVKSTVANTIYNYEMNQPGTFYKMGWVKKMGGINSSLRYVFDDELWFRYLSNNGIQKIKQDDSLIAHFRLHESSKTVNDGFVEFAKEINAIFLGIGEDLNFPKGIIVEMERLSHSKDYQKKKWNYSALNKEELLAWFCNQHQYSLYKNFNYTDVRNAIKLITKHRIPVDKRKSLLLRLKLLLSNKLLDFIRKRQKQHATQNTY